MFFLSSPLLFPHFKTVSVSLAIHPRHVSISFLLCPCKTFLGRNCVTDLISICTPLRIPYLLLPSLPIHLLLFFMCSSNPVVLHWQRKSKNKLVRAGPVDTSQSDLEQSLFFSTISFFGATSTSLSLSLSYPGLFFLTVLSPV